MTTFLQIVTVNLSLVIVIWLAIALRYELRQSHERIDTMRARFMDADVTPPSWARAVRMALWSFGGLALIFILALGLPA